MKKKNKPNDLKITDEFLEWLKGKDHELNKEFYHWKNTRWDEKK